MKNPPKIGKYPGFPAWLLDSHREKYVVIRENMKASKDISWISPFLWYLFDYPQIKLEEVESLHSLKIAHHKSFLAVEVERCHREINSR